MTARSNCKTVLLINYLFPPCGGSGVQRALKLAKYLPSAGWQTVVETVKDINYLVYDLSLLKEIPPDVEIVRTESFDPQRLSILMMSSAVKEASKNSGVVRNTTVTEGSRVLGVYRRVRDCIGIPDIWIGWTPFAVFSGWKTIRRRKVDAIVGMVGSGTTAIITYLLSRLTGVPYLLDLRDGWTEDPDETYPTGFHRWVNGVFERWTMKNVAALTVYGDSCREAFEQKYPWLKGKVTVIPNGFDRADLKEVVPQQRATAKRRIVYMGSLNVYHEKTFQSFLDAVRSLPKPVLANLEILFVGRAFAQAPEHVSASGLSNVVSFVPYAAHAIALGYLVSADASLLLIRASDRQSLTGKLFEYLMAGPPILACIEPESACADVLRTSGHAEWITPPDSPDQIRNTIVAMATAGWPRPENPQVEQYSRERNAAKLASILDGIVARKDAVVVGEHLPDRRSESC